MRNERYERVEFLKPVPVPSERGSAERPDGVTAAEGYVITRSGSDVVIYHERFAGRVVVVPFSGCVVAWASEDEMTRPETKGKR